MLPISLGLPLKATPENLIPRMLILYVLRHMHIESKVEHVVSCRCPLTLIHTEATQLTGHEQSHDIRFPSHLSDRTMRVLNMLLQLWISEGLVHAGEPW